MALQGPFEMNSERLFPHGLSVLGLVTPATLPAKDGRRPEQDRDKVTGLPLWHVDVVDHDPDARQKAIRVKIAAAVQPVPPEALPGTPLRPVVLEGLRMMPWGEIKYGRDDKPRAVINYSLKCTGLAAPGAGRRSGDASKAA